MFKSVNAFSSFAAKDLKKTKDFYSKTLGLSVKEDKQMGLLNMDLGNKNLVMVYPKPDQKPANFTIFNLVVKDIDKAVDDLAAKGVKFDKYPGFGQDKKGIARPSDANPGPSIAWFKDPDGNILAV